MMMFMLIVFVGIEIPTIELVFGMIGATAGNLLALILPAAFYITLANKKGEDGEYPEQRSKSLIMAGYISILVGLFIGTIGIIFMY
jgi:hypothetical protein